MRARLPFDRVARLGRHSASPSLAAALLLASTGALTAQAPRSQPRTARAVATTATSAPDARWLPWIGCWQTADSDAVASPNGAARYTCVLPTERTSAVDIVDVAGGTVGARTQLDADGRSHPIDQAGCTGDQTGAWAQSEHRLYLRATYTCAGVSGTSTRMFAIAPNGDWLEIENIRAGGGSIEHVTRRRAVGIPSGIPSSVARPLAGRELAISTARASAAAPIGSSDVIEAVHSVDPGVVREWLVASNTHMQLSGADASALMHADVPASVVQAMMGVAGPATEAEMAEANMRADEYLRSTSIGTMGIPTQGATPMQPTYFPNMPICNAGGCSTPVVPYSPYDGYYPYGVYPYAPYPGYVVGTPFVVIRGQRRVPPHVVPRRPGPVGIPAPRTPPPHVPMRPRP